MKMALVVLLALMLAGCAARGPVESSEERDEAPTLFRGCTERGCR